MIDLRNMPRAGFVVILVIAALFVLAVVLLMHVYLRYKLLAGKAGGNTEEAKGFKGALLNEYVAAYKKYGRDVNTPAIITDVIGSRLSGLLLCERFLNNAVSLFVTLGLLDGVLPSLLYLGDGIPGYGVGNEFLLLLLHILIHLFVLVVEIVAFTRKNQ